MAAGLSIKKDKIGEFKDYIKIHDDKKIYMTSWNEKLKKSDLWNLVKLKVNTIGLFSLIIKI